ncbi:hypothetical protein SAMN05421823_10650 [Catalinimonas alkaloidigena]|uniref:LTXXQ motif family protein n=1 Tax=Catalinimonas alkaloidigena TaxID=1075417 RepID=A0A1G9K597_9BACT|nr:Spy/CpxP family protein refolding chaperone [Catalinimonas alkaloidigena]SDL44706.1 hypothetical protein SAMN05421823_10650 [Catalinimonas alkaloidigena]
MKAIHRFLKSGALVGCLMLCAFTLQAQSRAERSERLEQAKIAHFTNRLALSSEQAQRFWPIYNEFSDKRRANHRQMRRFHATELDSLSDQQITQQLQAMMKMREAEVQMEKEYLAKFMEVLSPRQVAQLYEAEREFARMVMRRLKDHPPRDEMSHR